MAGARGDLSNEPEFPTIGLFLSLSHTHTLCLFLSLSLTHTLSLSHTHSLSPSHTHTHTLSHTLALVAGTRDEILSLSPAWGHGPASGHTGPASGRDMPAGLGGFASGGRVVGQALHNKIGVCPLLFLYYSRA